MIPTTKPLQIKQVLVECGNRMGSVLQFVQLQMYNILMYIKMYESSPVTLIIQCFPNSRFFFLFSFLNSFNGVFALKRQDNRENLLRGKY